MINKSFSHKVIANNIDSTDVNARDTNIITVFEHQRLIAHDFLRVSDFHWLMAQEFAVFSIKRRQGQWQLKVGHYIGVILLPSGMTLEILPKLAAKTSSDQVAQQSYLSQNTYRRQSSPRYQSNSPMGAGHAIGFDQ